MSFNFSVPTNALFGAGKLGELHTQINTPMGAVHGSKALVVISNGKSTRTNGYLDRLENELKQKNCPVTAWEYAGEGGILTAVWNLSGIYNVGVDIDLRMIPMKQAVVEVCEIFEVNPYRLFSENCVILACDRGGQMVRSLSAQGIPAAVIGSTEKGIARVIRHGEETAGYLERPRADELSRIDGNTI